MLSFLPAEAAAFVATVALALLPGLLVVRSPWTTVPAVSVAFWVLSWWWVPLGSRSGMLSAGLVMFAVLALLRIVPRSTVPPPPEYDGPAPEPPVTGPTTGDPPRLRSLPSLLVVLTAVALLAPLPLWPHVPGPEMAFHTSSTRLALWRDGLPRTYEPLFGFGPFGAHSPALPTLAADLGLVSGLDPGRAVSAAALLPAALCLLGLFAALGTSLDPAAAALAALLGLAAAPRGWLAVWGQGGPLLALALCLSAAALLRGHRSRSSAVAAGGLLAAALLSQPLLAGVLTAVAMGVSRIEHRRFALAVGVALMLATPGLWGMLSALSVPELQGVLTSGRAGEWAGLLLGAAVLVVSAVIAGRLARLPGPGRALDFLLAAASAVVLAMGVHFGPSAGQIDPERLRDLSQLAEDVRPLEPVCAEAGLADWVPALGARPPGMAPGAAPPWVPAVLRDEAAETGLPRCATNLDAWSAWP